MARSGIKRSRGTVPEMDIVTGVRPVESTPAEVTRRFRNLVATGAELLPAGLARREPEILLTRAYVPRYEISLFDVTYFLTDYRFDDGLGFFVGYVVMGERNGSVVRRVYPRIFYKDSSLVWRVASHFVHDYEEYWIGKGEVRVEQRADGEYLASAEETTNLPYEIQAALDDISRRGKRRRDGRAVELLLREGPSGRLEPYADFTTPRRRAAERYQVNGGRPVARFLRAGDPASLRFTPGFEPDLVSGLLEVSRAGSRFFGGVLAKARVLSTNRKIQYLFLTSPTHVWLNPPQALTTELSSYGVRVHDVLADEYLFVPAYEYHEVDGDDGEVTHSQIPPGYAGAAHPDDPSRADASAWLEKLPVIREFRRKMFGKLL